MKSKHINLEKKTTNPRPFISRILNSKSLSKEIYQQFMPSELDFDTIKGLSKWRSELETDIYFENVFSNISKITYDYKLQNFQYKLLHRILPTILFWLKLESKDSDLCSLYKIATNYIMHYIWQCPKDQEFWQQVGRWLEEIFEISIQLNTENTVQYSIQIRTNFHTRSSTLYYFLQNTLSIAVNGPIICQPLDF
jgi:hypothetical protein